MAKKRRVAKKRRAPKQKITFIFFHGDAMDLVSALEEKIAESGLSMETVIRAVQSAGIDVTPRGVAGPTPMKPN